MQGLVVNAAMVLLLGVAACSSQSDNFDRPDIVGASAEDGGVFRITMRGNEGNSQWIYFFGPEEEGGADNRIVAYRDNQEREEFLSGRFVVNDQSPERRANVLWFDMIDVEPEPDDITPDDESQTTRQRRVRSAVLSVTLLADGRIFGTLSGEGIDETVDGQYEPLWYEEISGGTVLTGEWRELDAFGREEISIQIDAGGGFGGRRIDDCLLSGDIQTINPRFNLYEIFVSSLCNETLDATGLATVRLSRDNPEINGASTLIGVVPFRDGSEVLGLFLDAEVEPNFGTPAD